jgi:predicted HTH transcriptional regulator
VKDGVFETTEYLELFLRNLILGENHELHNRDMHVSGELKSHGSDPINDPINDPIKLDDRERIIIRLIRDNQGITRNQIAEIIGCSESTVKRCIQKMTADNIIRRIGSNKNGEWIVLIDGVD